MMEQRKSGRNYGDHGATTPSRGGSNDLGLGRRVPSAGPVYLTIRCQNAVSASGLLVIRLQEGDGALSGVKPALDLPVWVHIVRALRALLTAACVVPEGDPALLQKDLRKDVAGGILSPWKGQSSTGSLYQDSPSMGWKFKGAGVAVQSTPLGRRSSSQD